MWFYLSDTNLRPAEHVHQYAAELFVRFYRRSHLIGYGLVAHVSARRHLHGRLSAQGKVLIVQLYVGFLTRRQQKHTTDLLYRFSFV